MPDARGFSTLLRSVVVISLFGVLDFFENLMKAMDRVPREMDACVHTHSIGCASSFEGSQIPGAQRLWLPDRSSGVEDHLPFHQASQEEKWNLKHTNVTFCQLTEEHVCSLTLGALHMQITSSLLCLLEATVAPLFSALRTARECRKKISFFSDSRYLFPLYHDF